MTSSSDGHSISAPAGPRAAGAGNVNAKYGIDPGGVLYTHVSGRFGPFFTRVITATQETVPNMGVLTSAHGRPGAGMEWRVTIEFPNGADGTKQTHEVARRWRHRLPLSPLDPLGLTLDDGKILLAGVQRHLVQARVAEYSALRRHWSHCRGLRPLKDTRTRRLGWLFGTVEVPAPQFKPRPCAVTSRATLCPASELMPDRCTPEYERALAKMGAWLPYRHARRFLSEFFPLGDDPLWHETIRRRTIRAGGRPRA